MKKLIFLLLLVCNKSLAQFYHPENLGPVYFDQFIRAPKIDWAAFFIDTFRFNKTNLSEILRKRFEDNEIKIRRPGDLINFYNPKMKYSTKDDLKSFHTWRCVLPIFDSLGNVFKSQDKNNEKRFPINFDSTDYNLLSVAQIFYIETNKLKVYIPFVSPKMTVKTSSGVELGLTDYFVTSFNFNYSYSMTYGDKIIVVQQTNKKINLDSIGSIYGSYNLKQFYERNLLQTLWPYILDKKLAVYSVQSNKRLSPTELNPGIIDAPAIVVPVFDSLGNVTAHQNFWPDDNLLDHIKTIEITQTWYYNQTKNIVYCTIPQVILFAKRFKNGEFEKDSSPILKIIF